jgi:hypothetical protein
MTREGERWESAQKRRREIVKGRVRISARR